jgi:hypothetical protein
MKRESSEKPLMVIALELRLGGIMYQEICEAPRLSGTESHRSLLLEQP